jgi:hypothetical protein
MKTVDGFKLVNFAPQIDDGTIEQAKETGANRNPGTPSGIGRRRPQAFGAGRRFSRSEARRRFTTDG